MEQLKKLRPTDVSLLFQLRWYSLKGVCERESETARNGLSENKIKYYLLFPSKRKSQSICVLALYIDDRRNSCRALKKLSQSKRPKMKIKFFFTAESWSLIEAINPEANIMSPISISFSWARFYFFRKKSRALKLVVTTSRNLSYTRSLKSRLFYFFVNNSSSGWEKEAVWR